MRLRIVGYVASVMLVGFGGIIGSIVAQGFPPGEGTAAIGLAATHMALSVMTYPLGVLAEAVFLVPFFLGIATHEEALVLATPFYALLGYLQWFRLIPAFYRGRT